MSMSEEEDMTIDEIHENIEVDVTNRVVSGKPPLLPKRKMKPRSEVWDHFSVFYDNRGKRNAKCNYCPKAYLSDSKSCGTSTLLIHMKSCIHSPMFKKKDVSQMEICMQRLSDDSGTVSNWKFDPIVARKKLVLMIIKDEFAFSIVDDEGFIEFVEYLAPRFKIPSRWTISRDIFELFLDEKIKLRDFFKESGTTVCITTDTWTSMQRVSYMCIAAHYVDNNWNLNKKIINFSLVEGHKGEEMARQIDACLREWGIAKVLAITVDNASANDKCLDYLKGRLGNRGCLVVDGKYLHMRCAAHIVNLIVVDGLKIINSSIKKVRDAIRYVKHSPGRLTRFKECCVDENIDCKSLLCLDVPTRWNSTYLMLSVAIKFEKAFERFEIEDPHFKIQLNSDKNTNEGGGVPTQADWDIARRITEILLVFYDVTLKVSASLHVTSHLLYHEIENLGSLLREWIAETTDTTCPYIRDMGLMMQLKFEKYWGNAMEMNKLIHLSVILDPRYKLKFISYVFMEEFGMDEGSKLIFDLKTSLMELYDHYKTLQPQSQSQSVEYHSSSQSSQSSDIMASLPKKSRKSRSEQFM